MSEEWQLLLERLGYWKERFLYWPLWVIQSCLKYSWLQLNSKGSSIDEPYDRSPWKLHGNHGFYWTGIWLTLPVLFNYNLSIKIIWKNSFQSVFISIVKTVAGINFKLLKIFTDVTDSETRHLINFYSPWNHQKTVGFLMISGEWKLINSLKFA